VSQAGCDGVTVLVLGEPTAVETLDVVCHFLIRLVLCLAIVVKGFCFRGPRLPLATCYWLYLALVCVFGLDEVGRVALAEYG